MAKTFKQLVEELYFDNATWEKKKQNESKNLRATLLDGMKQGFMDNIKPEYKSQYKKELAKVADPKDLPKLVIKAIQSGHALD